LRRIGGGDGTGGVAAVAAVAGGKSIGVLESSPPTSAAAAAFPASVFESTTRADAPLKPDGRGAVFAEEPSATPPVALLVLLGVLSVFAAALAE
jgi:hypothetical protein